MLITVGGIFITLICLLNAQNFSSLIYGSSVYHRVIIICSLTILPYVIFESLGASFAGLRVFKLASLFRFTQFFIFTALGIVLVILYPKAESAIWANLISFIIVVLLFSLIFKKYLMGLSSQSLKIEEGNFYRKIFKFSVWFIISPVIYTSFSYTDRLMLSHLTDLSYVGIYSVALNISGLIFMFGMIAGNVLIPNLSNIWEQGDKDEAMYVLNFAIKINTLFLLTGAVILFLFRKQIVSVLYGAEYIKCLPVIGILLIFWLFNSIYWTIGGYAQLIEKTYIPLLCSSIGLISNIFLNYILIPKYGIMGAAVATTSSFAVILIATYFWFREEGLKVKLNTILVCILPIMFIFNNILIVLLFLILIGITLRTDIIINKEEKIILNQQVKRVFKRNIIQ